MNELDTTRCLHEVFGSRTLHHIPGEPRTVRPGGDTGTSLLILDLGLSRAILRSRSFVSINDFAEGYARLAARGRAVPVMDSTFKALPLFLEGPPARDTRRTLVRLLRQQEDVLAREEGRITALMLARRQRLRSPLAFSRLLVELCMTSLIQDLVPMSPRRPLRALRQRQNIFYFHFHGLRHQASEQALHHLYAQSGEPVAISPEMLLCESMVLMGSDPLVATVCASLLEAGNCPHTSAPSRYCPVSFVTRICTEDVSLDGLDVRRNDRCYLTLVPAKEEPTAERFPFGAGPHACIGRSLSLRILALAQRIVDQGFRSGFADTSELAPDGAFLAFTDPGGQPVRNAG